MKMTTLGRTGLRVPKPGFGALPIQRCGMDEAVSIIRAAYEGGFRFFDTANAYSDSEEKLGAALADVRGDVVLATKSMATDRDTALAHIRLSLRRLRTGYIDLFQFHCVSAMPDPGDPNGAYAAALEAREQGLIGHIGVTTHLLGLAEEMVDSGLFETLQFPFSYLASDREKALVRRCLDAGMGFIAMKGLAGGLLNNARACHAFMTEQEGVVPIWGIQRMEEVREWLDLAREDPGLDGELRAVIEADRRELAGDFCRGCGYCMPCPVDIEIRNSARMNMLLRRSPWEPYMTDEWHEKMHRIDNCLGCNKCASRCPYGLDTPKILKHMLKDYDEFYAAHKSAL